MQVLGELDVLLKEWVKRGLVSRLRFCLRNARKAFIDQVKLDTDLCGWEDEVWRAAGPQVGELEVSGRKKERERERDEGEEP